MSDDPKILEILKFPDPRLRKKAVAVERVTPVLQAFVKNLLHTMYASNGIGLAAPQVGEPVRLLVVDTRPRDTEGRYTLEGLTELEKKVEQPFVIFNPEIVSQDGKTTYEEGCLSVPGYYETVERANSVLVEGLNLQGEKFRVELDGLLAICVQHEIDHLDGKLFIDRLSPIKSNRVKNKIKKHGYPDLEDDEALEGEAEVEEAKL